MNIFAGSAVHPQGAQPFGELRIAGRDHAAIAEPAQIFARKKAETRGGSERPGAPAVVFGADGLRRIFNDK